MDSISTDCALLPTRISQSDEKQFFHLSHSHSLTPTEITDDDRFYCSACRRCLLDQTFVCRKCSFFLHKSCFDLPREIQHAYHPTHPLILQAKPSKFKSVYNVCCKNLTGLTYRCELCDIEMHTECTLPMPTISYKGHSHLLVFLENVNTEVQCNSCETTGDSCVFHCVECDFNLHLKHGPFPCTVQPECHYHSVTLTYSPLEDELEEFYCDICEKEKDPCLSTVAVFLFPAEIKYVMSEVCRLFISYSNISKGNYGDVELRTLVGQINGKLYCRSLDVL